MSLGKISYHFWISLGESPFSVSCRAIPDSESWPSSQSQPTVPSGNAEHQRASEAGPIMASMQFTSGSTTTVSTFFLVAQPAIRLTTATKVKTRNFIRLNSLALDYELAAALDRGQEPCNCYGRQQRPTSFLCGGEHQSVPAHLPALTFSHPVSVRHWE